MTQRTTEQALQWYQTHEVYPGQLSYQPNGMCQRICRDARNIGPGAPSALAGALMTPDSHRVHKIEDITKGMVMYFDDPDDSNPYGHIVTVMGRAKGADRGDMHGIIVRTNSVKSSRIVPVRADYFNKFWRDPFMFAGTWINGVALDLPDAPADPQKKSPLGRRAIDRLNHVKDILGDMAENHEAAGHTRLAKALRRDRREVQRTIDNFGRRKG